MIRTVAYAVAVAVLFGSTLTVAASREQQQMMADIRMLQEQNQRLQLMLDGLVRALESLDTRLDTQAGVDRKAFADQNLLIERLSSDMRILREKVDDTNVRISSLSQELEALRVTMPPMAAPMPAEGAGAPTTGEGQAAPAAGLAPGMSPQRLYETAWADYTAGQFDMAILGFETYIRSFPRGDMADNAQFFIGDSLYAAGRFEEAVQAYDRVIANYDGTDAVPDAYYKRGLALDRLGEREEARKSFEAVIEKFPDTTPSSLARQALERLSRAGRG